MQTEAFQAALNSIQKFADWPQQVWMLLQCMLAAMVIASVWMTRRPAGHSWLRPSAISHAVIALCILQFAALSFQPRMFGGGFNHSIYQHNAALTLDGKPAFHRTDAPNSESHASVDYLDYTGAQHAAYVGMEAVSRSASGLMPNFGYRLWNFVAAALAILLLASLARGRTDFSPPLAVAVLIACHPVVPMVWLTAQWEDKVVFLTIPLLVAILLQRNRTIFAACVVGATCTFNGILILFAPLLLVGLYVERRKLPWAEALALITSSAVFLIPFLPDALAGWQRRSLRSTPPQVLWFSLYRVIEPLYFPKLSYVLWAVGTTALGALLVLRRLSLPDCAVLAFTAFMLCSADNNTQRLVPVSLLLLAFLPRISAPALAVYAGLLALAVFFRFEWRLFTWWASLLVHAHVLFALGLFIRSPCFATSPNLPADPQNTKHPAEEQKHDSAG